MAETMQMDEAARLDTVFPSVITGVTQAGRAARAGKIACHRLMGSAGGDKGRIFQRVAGLAQG
jgi:hypothetical protein